MSAATPPLTARRSLWRVRLRKFVFGLNSGLGIFLMLVLWGMVNYLGSRHYTREDWSSQQLTVLSEETTAILAEIQAPVRLMVFAGKDFRGRDELDDLLKEYQSRSRFIEVEQVDPQRDLGRSEEWIVRYGLAKTEQMIVQAGDRSEVIDLAAMVVMEPEATRPLGQDPRMVGFQGESLLTSALFRAIHPGPPPKVYFLTGHGEKDVNLFDAVPQGYSDIRERLERDHVAVHVLDLASGDGIPADCAVLVIAGPTTRISQPELDLIRRYMEGHGRLMVLLDVLQDGGLQPLLQEYGIQLLPDMVVDPAQTLQGVDVHVTQYGRHAITRGMQGLRSIFIRPRSVLPVPNLSQGADRPTYVPLLACSERGWAELSLDEEPIVFTDGIDQPGPIPMAAAVEEIRGSSPPGPVTRLVVFGDSDFPSNWLRSGGGQQLFHNAVKWLLERDRLIAIPPKPVEEIRLAMNRQTLNRLLFLSVVVLPGCVVALGLAVAWRRRR